MGLVARVAFLCFMDNFFSHLLSLAPPLSLAYNGLSLPWPDTIHASGEGGWWVRCKLKLIFCA